MRFLALLLCALFVVAAKPIDPLPALPQRILHDPAAAPLPSIRRPIRHTVHFDAAPNSVGLLLTSAGEQRVKHVWLPLGKRIETRKSSHTPASLKARSELTRIATGDSPTLPSHPISARITTLIHSSPELATPERLDKIKCAVHLHVNETSAADSRWEAKFGRRKKPKKQAPEEVLFRRADGLVRLADVESEFWLNGAEVEAYECR